MTREGRRLADRIARAFVSTGGLAIIASILAILVFLVLEVHPLWTHRTYRVEEPRLLPVAARAVAVDPYQTHAALLCPDGEARAIRLADGQAVASARVVPEDEAIDRFESVELPDHFAIATSKGRVHAVKIAFDLGFDGERRVVTPRFSPTPPIDVHPAGQPLLAFTLQVQETGTSVAAQLADGSMVVVARTIELNPISGEKQESEQRLAFEAPFRFGKLLLDREAKNLYAGTHDGRVCWWPLVEGRAGPMQAIPVSSVAISSLGLLLGDRSLIVGCADGALSQWFPVRQGDSTTFQLTRIREFEPLTGQVLALATAARHKGFVALGAGGQIAVCFATTGSRRWSETLRSTDAIAISLAPKCDAAFAIGPTWLRRVVIDDPHPEASLGVLFGKTWYEGADGPAYTWQSTGGTDEFEPKLSLVPLIFGTLKGTFFSMLVAVPLAVLGAMYVAHFMHPRLRRIVKPFLELMAAVPSVVLGFVAALWLAPRVEQNLGALVIAPVVLPLAVLAVATLAARLRLRWLAGWPAGAETFGFVIVLVAAGYGCTLLGPALEGSLLGTDLVGWLSRHLGVRYEQQNAVVVGLAMSFAITPIIFSISEESFANVPKSLVSGSLALGASRWQTVTRVVLPTASPGIFSAIMVGFGRAIGETMIVVMAAGATPILDPSLFNGFRTLSANIAGEITEAPQGGTLYRVLFLAALLLFTFTFVINTIAEVVRQRLRERYS